MSDLFKVNVLQINGERFIKYDDLLLREFSRRFWAIRNTLFQNVWENSRLHNVSRVADLFLAIVKDILKNKCR